MRNGTYTKKKLKPNAPRSMDIQKTHLNISGQIRLPTDVLAVLAGEAPLLEAVPTCVDVGLLLEAPDAEDVAETEADEAEVGLTPHCSANWSKPVACSGSNGCTQAAQAVIACKPTGMKNEQVQVVELHVRDWIYAVRVEEH